MTAESYPTSGGRGRRRRLVTLRLIREATFPAPEGFQYEPLPIRSPHHVIIGRDRYVSFAEAGLL